MAETPRATLGELKRFANKVRKAGGGNPIDALMPSVPEDTEQCLIARNLNFNCEVEGIRGPYDDGEADSITDGAWAMWVSTKELRDKIADTLGLRKLDPPNQGFGILLPPEIGQCAADFDAASDLLGRLEYEIEDWAYELEMSDEGVNLSEKNRQKKAVRKAWKNLTADERKLLRDMVPYIEESQREAYALATCITPEGKIVL